MKRVDLTPTAVLNPSTSKPLIDDFMIPLLAERTEEARRINPHYETLWQDIQKLYNAGGKRLRSYMTLLAFETFSEKPVTSILPAAAAQELLHIAMLIHDDIIDRDDIRHGIKNISGEYMDHYEEIIEDAHDRRHYASSAAILAGDLLISEAYILITETDANPAAILTAQRLLSKAMFQVIGGELLDTEAAFRGADAADPLAIAEQKTASYSFVGPFLTGATLAEATPIQLERLQRFGEQLGIAYQLRDDMIGIFGNQQATGKSVSGDILEGKRTFLIEEFNKLADETQRITFDALFGRHDLKAKEIDTVRALLVESGAKAAVETLINAYQKHTHVLLNELDLDEAHHAAFSSLIDMCLTRDY
ncbi:MAG TPA: polyprenyl synthetase family protein [Candidatus Microsaccharimonas sp.]|jgi:geranylgeranyl diphosphate synthase type II